MKKLLLTTFIFLALPLATQASATVGQANTSSLQNGLVGWWTFDGSKTNWATNTTQDSSGNGNTGTLISIATSTKFATSSGPVAGKVGQALKFNGSTSYVTVPNSSSINLGAGDFSISGWLKFNDLNAAYGIFGKGNGPPNAGGTGLELRLRSAGSSRLNFYLDANGTGSVTLLSTSQALSGNFLNWQHVVIVVSRSGTVSNVYINGILAGSAAGAASFTDTYPFLIGGSIDTAFPGSIDDVRIYNRALSAQEVAQLYVNGGGNIAHSNTVSLSSGLVGYWTLDGSKTNWATNTTADSSGNGNTGTLVSIATSTKFATSSGPVAGKIGQGLKFDGSVSTVSFPAFQLTNVTYSAWIKGSAWTGNGAILAQKGSLLQINSGGGAITWFPDVTTSSVSCPNTFSLGKWYHVVVTQSGTAYACYVNGTAVGSGTAAAIGVTNTSNTIGSYASGRYFNGTIDDVRIYNRAISAQEVAQLYVNGGENIAHSNTVSLSSGLVGYWTLDGSKTSWNTNTTQDSSGNGNTGTLIQVATSTASTSGPVAGKVGQAMKFDGTNAYIVNTAPSNLSTGGAARTLSAWIKPSNTNPGGVIVGYGGVSGQVFTMQTGVVSGTTYLFTDGVNGSNNVSITGSQIPPTNAWSLMTFTFDGSTNWKYYLNGSLTKSGTYAVAINTAAVTKVVVGATPQAFITKWPGSIDDVRIYNRALSTQEVAQLYAMGR